MDKLIGFEDAAQEDTLATPQLYGIFEADISDILTSPCSVSLHMGLLKFGLFEAINSKEVLHTSHFPRFLCQIRNMLLDIHKSLEICMFLSIFETVKIHITTEERKYA